LNASVASTAAYASITLPPPPHVVGRAVRSIRSATWNELRLGWSAHTNAASAATCGVAADVPPSANVSATAGELKECTGEPMPATLPPSSELAAAHAGRAGSVVVEVKFSTTSVLRRGFAASSAAADHSLLRSAPAGPGPSTLPADVVCTNLPSRLTPACAGSVPRTRSTHSSPAARANASLQYAWASSTVSHGQPLRLVLSTTSPGAFSTSSSIRSCRTEPVSPVWMSAARTGSRAGNSPVTASAASVGTPTASYAPATTPRTM
jgi:hypothetical protein